jgi:hypothetical protein
MVDNIDTDITTSLNGKSTSKRYYDKVKDTPEWKIKKAMYNRRYQDKKRETHKENVVTSDANLNNKLSTYEKKLARNHDYYSRNKDCDEWKERKSQYNKIYQMKSRERKAQDRNLLETYLNRLDALEAIIRSNGQGLEHLD